MAYLTLKEFENCEVWNRNYIIILLVVGVPSFLINKILGLNLNILILIFEKLCHIYKIMTGQVKCGQLKFI